MQRLQSVQNFVLGGARIPIRPPMGGGGETGHVEDNQRLKGGNATIVPNGTIPMVECAHLDVRNAAMRSVHVPIWR